MSIQDTISTGSVVSGLGSTWAIVLVVFLIVLLIANFISFLRLGNKVHSLRHIADTNKHRYYCLLYQANGALLALHLCLIILIAI